MKAFRRKLGAWSAATLTAALGLGSIASPAEAQEQHIRLELPALPPGAQLELGHVPQGSSGTAYGYIRDLRLD